MSDEVLRILTTLSSVILLTTLGEIYLLYPLKDEDTAVPGKIKVSVQSY